jgi:hypothetical protein
VDAGAAVAGALVGVADEVVGADVAGVVEEVVVLSDEPQAASVTTSESSSSPVTITYSVALLILPLSC